VNVTHADLVKGAVKRKRPHHCVDAEVPPGDFRKAELATKANSKTSDKSMASRMAWKNDLDAAQTRFRWHARMARHRAQPRMKSIAKRMGSATTSHVTVQRPVRRHKSLGSIQIELKDTNTKRTVTPSTFLAERQQSRRKTAPLTSRSFLHRREPPSLEVMVTKSTRQTATGYLSVTKVRWVQLRPAPRPPTAVADSGKVRLQLLESHNK